jgi:hypothetical protein
MWVYDPPMTFKILSVRWIGNTGCPAKSSAKGSHSSCMVSSEPSIVKSYGLTTVLSLKTYSRNVISLFVFAVFHLYFTLKKIWCQKD